VLARGDSFGSAELVSRGGYVYADARDGAPEVIIIATGSELQFAVEAKIELDAFGIATRVVSMPCVEWFEEQPEDYRNAVLDPRVTKRISIEAGLTSGWRSMVGDEGTSIGINHYGASADYKTLYREFGITAAAVVSAAKKLSGR
jgi:transketolase